MKMFQIGYCGAKQERADTVAGTGLVWKPDTVHTVTEAVAAKLLNHPDIWYVVEALEVEPDKPAKKAETQTETKTETETGKKEEKTEDDPFAHVNLQAMTKDALAKFAHREFGKELNQTETKAALMEQVTNLMKRNQP